MLSRSGPRAIRSQFGIVSCRRANGFCCELISLPHCASAALLAMISVGISVFALPLIVSSFFPWRRSKRITDQLDRISKGEFDQKPLKGGDEFGQVSTKISQIGMQPSRRAGKFSAICARTWTRFSAGLDDGLLLFSCRWPGGHGEPRRRAVSFPHLRISSWGAARKTFSRRIMLSGRQFRPAKNGELQPVDSAEVVLSGIDGPPRRGGSQRRGHRRRRRTPWGHLLKIQGLGNQRANRHAVASFRAPCQSWDESPAGVAPRSEKIR